MIGRAGQFRRVLGLWQLTCIGLGGLIGVGIFVLTGVVVAIQAGPTAYTYAYAVLGELVAWLISWDLLLEYALVVASYRSVGRAICKPCSASLA